jgi:hypothetical protein
VVVVVVVRGFLLLLLGMMVLRLLRLSVDVVIPAPAVAPAAAPTTAAVVVVAVPLAPPHYRPSLSLLSSECSWLLALWAARRFLFALFL